jgi:hypothetical protein
MAITASTFYSPRGKRAGLTVARWCGPMFPIAYFYSSTLYLIFLWR